MPVISIFGSGKISVDSQLYKSAEFSGKILAENGFELATGGYYGIMEAALKGASAYNFKRIAVVSRFFGEKLPNNYVTEIIETKTYDERLKKLIDIANGYLIFPGGSGTLLEFSYLFAMKERKIIENKIAVCIGQQWIKILELAGYDSSSAFLKSLNFYFEDNVNNAVKKIVNYFK